MSMRLGKSFAALTFSGAGKDPSGLRLLTMVLRKSADLMHGVPLGISSLSSLYTEKGSREGKRGSTLRPLPRTGELDVPCI